MLGLIFLFFSFTVCASLSSNIWLSKWTDNANVTSGIYYMNIYSALGITQGKIFNIDIGSSLSSNDE